MPRTEFVSPWITLTHDSAGTLPQWLLPWGPLLAPRLWLGWACLLGVLGGQCTSRESGEEGVGTLSGHFLGDLCGSVSLGRTAFGNPSTAPHGILRSRWKRRWKRRWKARVSPERQGQAAEEATDSSGLISSEGTPTCF